MVGHEVSRISLLVNGLAVKYLALPISLQDDQEYEKFSNLFGIGLDRKLGSNLSNQIVSSIR